MGKYEVIVKLTANPEWHRGDMGTEWQNGGLNLGWPLALGRESFRFGLLQTVPLPTFCAVCPRQAASQAIDRIWNDGAGLNDTVLGIFLRGCRFQVFRSSPKYLEPCREFLFMPDELPALWERFKGVMPKYPEHGK